MVEDGVDIGMELPVKPPIGFEPVWEVYSQLNYLRENSMSAGPVMPTEVEKYIELTGQEFSEWDYELVFGLDRVFLEVLREIRKADEGNKPHGQKNPNR